LNSDAAQKNTDISNNKNKHDLIHNIDSITIKKKSGLQKKAAQAAKIIIRVKRSDS